MYKIIYLANTEEAKVRKRDLKDETFHQKVLLNVHEEFFFLNQKKHSDTKPNSKKT